MNFLINSENLVFYRSFNCKFPFNFLKRTFISLPFSFTKKCVGDLTKNIPLQYTAYITKIMQQLRVQIYLMRVNSSKSITKYLCCFNERTNDDLFPPEIKASLLLSSHYSSTQKKHTTHLNNRPHTYFSLTSRTKGDMCNNTG